MGPSVVAHCREATNTRGRDEPKHRHLIHALHVSRSDSWETLGETTQRRDVNPVAQGGLLHRRISRVPTETGKVL